MHFLRRQKHNFFIKSTESACVPFHNWYVKFSKRLVSYLEKYWRKFGVCIDVYTSSNRRKMISESVGLAAFIVVPSSLNKSYGIKILKCYNVCFIVDHMMNSYMRTKAALLKLTVLFTLKRSNQVIAMEYPKTKSGRMPFLNSLVEALNYYALDKRLPQRLLLFTHKFAVHLNT